MSILEFGALLESFANWGTNAISGRNALRAPLSRVVWVGRIK
jgi:hypothetical protein